MEQIGSEEISVVVQGPCSGDDTELARRIGGIRAILPRCELILSTYQDSQLPIGCHVDHIVRSPDPGAVVTNPDDPASKPYNLNRQITTTRAGLAVASRPFTIKLRTDCTISSDAFVRAFVKDRKPKDCSFRRRVVLLDVFTRSPVAFPALFHGSDIFHFGAVEDLRELWSAPLVSEPDFTHWFRTRPYPRPQLLPAQKLNIRLLPEQYICLEYFKRKVDAELELRAPLDISWLLFLKAERLMISHFLMLDWRSSGVVLPARFGLRSRPPRCYRAGTWKLLERALSANRVVFGAMEVPRFLGGLFRYQYTRLRQVLTDS